MAVKVAAELESSIREEAEAANLRLEVSFFKPNRKSKTLFPHWHFVDEASGDVVLHYWPSKGSYWIPDGGEKGIVDSPVEAMGLALRLMDIGG